MIPVLLIGRGGSRGVPGKNTIPILGRPLMVYPILAARHSHLVDRFFLSTDSEAIKSFGCEHGFEIIDRPPELASDGALVEDVVVHGYCEMLARSGDIEMFVLLFCNSATITPGIIDQGVLALRASPDLDSAVTVSPYNEFSPVRAKKLGADGLLVPYVDVRAIPGASCDRDSAATCYFCDCSAWILRPGCLDLDYGELPFRWMGRRSLPLFQAGGLDIDHDCGIAMTEHWLRKHGFTDTTTPYEP